jgi:hypothetical protein
MDHRARHGARSLLPEKDTCLVPQG